MGKETRHADERKRELNRFGNLYEHGDWGLPPYTSTPGAFRAHPPLVREGQISRSGWSRFWSRLQV